MTAITIKKHRLFVNRIVINKNGQFKVLNIYKPPPNVQSDGGIKDAQIKHS